MKTTVEKLRSTLSTQVTEDIFTMYRDLYKTYKKSIEQDTNIMQAIISQNNELKNQLTATNDRDSQLAIVAKAKELAKRFKQIKKERQMSYELLQENRMMKGVNT